jgi:hypothetical protein
MNYSVLVSDEFHTNSFSNWTNAEVSTILVKKLGEFIEDADRLYTVIGIYWQLSKVLYSDGTNRLKYSLTFLKMEKCNLARHFKSNPDLWEKEKYITHSNCISPDQVVNVSKPSGSDDSSYFSFWLQRCQNITTNKFVFRENILTKHWKMSFSCPDSLIITSTILF